MRIRNGRQIIGYEERGRGPTLVLLHAFPLDRRMWQPLTMELAHALRVVAIDFRGLGESTGTNPVTIEDAADDAAWLIDRLALGPVVVGGLSMGGYAALAFARKYPSLLRGLLLADTRAAPDEAAGRAARDQAITEVAKRGVGPYCKELVPKLLAPENDAARDFALAIATSQSPAGVAGALGALRDRPDATPGLAAIDVPTVVVVGALDSVTSPAEARGLTAAIRGAELIEIAGAGHLSAIEQPRRFAVAVDDLMRRVG